MYLLPLRELLHNLISKLLNSLRNPQRICCVCVCVCVCVGGGGGGGGMNVAIEFATHIKRDRLDQPLPHNPLRHSLHLRCSDWKDFLLLTSKRIL